MAWFDKKGRHVGNGDWPPGTERWGTKAPAPDKPKDLMRSSPMRQGQFAKGLEKRMTSEDFGTGPHHQHEHPTVHNLSPVQGADDYSEHYAGKAKWHYDRFGRTPGASLARAGLYDYRSKVARGYPK